MSSKNAKPTYGAELKVLKKEIDRVLSQIPKDGDEIEEDILFKVMDKTIGLLEKRLPDSKAILDIQLEIAIKADQIADRLSEIALYDLKHYIETWHKLSCEEPKAGSRYSLVFDSDVGFVGAVDTGDGRYVCVLNEKVILAKDEEAALDACNKRLIAAERGGDQYSELSQ